jgi:hypothetical protein
MEPSKVRALRGVIAALGAMLFSLRYVNLICHHRHCKQIIALDASFFAP